MSNIIESVDGEIKVNRMLRLCDKFGWRKNRFVVSFWGMRRELKRLWSKR